MTDYEMNKLAKVIVDMMMTKQQEYDKQFLEDVQLMVEDKPDFEVILESGLDKIQEKIDNLQTILGGLIHDQNFHKAAEIHGQIVELKTKYNL